MERPFKLAAKVSNGFKCEIKKGRKSGLGGRGELEILRSVQNEGNHRIFKGQRAKIPGAGKRG